MCDSSSVERLPLPVLRQSIGIMEGMPSSEILKLIYALLPGFVAAWLFYGLTAHPRLSPFERTVQALIFTGIIQVFVLAFREVALVLGNVVSIGIWTDNVFFVVSILWAVVVGACFSLFANKDWCHKWLRQSTWFKWFGGVTRRTSYPSEWFSVFDQEPRYVVLHLMGNRRLYGWPFAWPDHPDSGHFVMMEPKWLLNDGNDISLDTVHKMLVRAEDVEMVEFLKRDSEISNGTANSV